MIVALVLSVHADAVGHRPPVGVAEACGSQVGALGAVIVAAAEGKRFLLFRGGHCGGQRVSRELIDAELSSMFASAK